MPAIQQVNAGTRLLSMMLDHLLMSIIAAIFYIPFWIVFFVKIIKASERNEEPVLPFNGPAMYVALLGFSLYACKDCINGQSLAKRIFKHQVINNATGQPASPFRCLVRGLFCYIWPVEAIVALINPARRLGDRVAGTRVVTYNNNIPQPPVKLLPVLPAVLISFGLVLLAAIPLLNMSTHNKKAYNVAASQKLEQLYKDNMGNVMTANVEVFNKNKTPRIRYYIVVSAHLKSHYKGNDPELDKIEGAVINYLYAVFPRDSTTGRATFAFTDDRDISRSHRINLGNED